MTQFSGLERFVIVWAAWIIIFNTFYKGAVILGLIPSPSQATVDCIQN